MKRIDQLKSEIEELQTRYSSNAELMKKIEAEAVQKINDLNKQNSEIRDRFLRLSGAVEELERAKPEPIPEPEEKG